MSWPEFQAPPLPVALLKALADLPAEREVSYQERWESWFHDAEEIRAIRTHFADAPMTRAGLKALAELVKDSSGDPTLLRRLFLATMMWGWGSNTGRAREKVTAAVCDPAFGRKLQQVQIEVARGESEASYLAADEIVGCGRAYATKFLYFLGWPYEAGPDGERHLVLDSRVWSSLDSLLDEHWGMDPKFWRARKGRGVSVFVYLWYIRTLAGWAREAGCASDELEGALFQRAIPNRQALHIRPNHTSVILPSTPGQAKDFLASPTPHAFPPAQGAWLLHRFRRLQPPSDTAATCRRAHWRFPLGSLDRRSAARPGQRPVSAAIPGQGVPRGLCPGRHLADFDSAARGEREVRVLRPTSAPAWQPR